MTLANTIPRIVRQPLKSLRDYFVSLTYRGEGRFCPVCEKSSKKFGTYGVNRRGDARCMHCGSLERHRLTWLYFKSKTDLFEKLPNKMLHVAPEPVFDKLFSRYLGDAYITADLYNPNAMRKMDISSIDDPDETYDVIYCSHVLEHVPCDRKAIAELFRVLKPDGWAIVLVPITAEKTFEDLSITDPNERTRLFGQPDHVRVYGPDYVDRLRDAGFVVAVTSPSDMLSPDDAARMGINHEAGQIYFCTKK